MYQVSEHFSELELMCHCGRHTCLDHVIDIKLVDLLERIRAAVGKPVNVTSCYRCPEHNYEVGARLIRTILKALPAIFGCRI